MTDPAKCPTCGTPVPAGSPGGTCPRCLLAAGLESGGGDAGGAPSLEEVAREFPAFEILGVLGQGGMGVVYKARQRSLDRLVAIKVLPPEAAREPGFADRFQREARTLARLHHPHVVGVHEFGETNGLYYLVMEFVDGPTLREVIRDGLLAPAQALAIVPQICEALQYAHDQGVVHRDVKPENVLLDRAGRVRIADFGLAKLVQRTPVDLTLTRAGQVMGTLQYMAPEQQRAPDSVDHRADIYSLGVVFYEMLTGELPVGTFPPPSRRAGVDPRLDEVVTRALERDRERRWQKASEMGTRVDTIASAPEALPAAPRSPEVAPAPRLSRLAVASALGPPLAVLAGLVLGMAVRASGDRSGLAATAGMAVSGTLLLFSLILGMVAMTGIQNSAGRLTGRAFAITGIVLSLAAALVMFVSVLLQDPSDPPRPASPGSGPSPPVVAGLPPGHVRPPADHDIPTDYDTPEVLAAAAKVAGAPPAMTTTEKARLVALVEDMWVRIVTLLEREPNPDVRALSLPPSDRDRLAALTRAERRKAKDWNRLGVLFQEQWGEPAAAFHLAWVVLGPDGRSARVVRSSALSSLAYSIAFEDGRWFPSLGLFEMRSPVDVDGARNGWLDDEFAPPRRDPASRVTGGRAAMTDAERHEIARTFEEAIGRRALMGVYQERRGLDRVEFHVYQVTLDASGESGRFVVGSDEWTASIPFSRDGDDGWAFGTEVEIREGPPRPDDQDGWLHR